MTTLLIIKDGDKYVIHNKKSTIDKFSSFAELYNQLSLYARKREFNFFIDKSIPKEEKRSLENMILKTTKIYCDYAKPDDETRFL